MYRIRQVATGFSLRWTGLALNGPCNWDKNRAIDQALTHMRYLNA